MIIKILYKKTQFDIINKCFLFNDNLDMDKLYVKLCDYYIINNGYTHKPFLKSDIDYGYPLFNLSLYLMYLLLSYRNTENIDNAMKILLDVKQSFFKNDENNNYTLYEWIFINIEILNKYSEKLPFDTYLNSNVGNEFDSYKNSRYSAIISDCFVYIFDLKITNISKNGVVFF